MTETLLLNGPWHRTNVGAVRDASGSQLAEVKNFAGSTNPARSVYEIVALAKAITAVPYLIQTLKLWKCASCGGRGTYQQDKKGRERKEALGQEIDTDYQPDPVTCSRCSGDGLEPIAHAALVMAGIIERTTP